MTHVPDCHNQQLSVTVLGAKKGRVSAYLDDIGIPNRMLLTQEGGRLPDMRPPLLLDASSMRPLELAWALHGLAAGQVRGWGRAPFPAAAVVRPDAQAHLCLLASSPAITVVLPEPPEPALLSIALRVLAHPGANQGQVWLGPCRPQLDRGLNICEVLAALDGAESLTAAFVAAHLSRATFYRRLEEVRQALMLPAVSGRQSAGQWLETLLQGMEAYSCAADSSHTDVGPTRAIARGQVI